MKPNTNDEHELNMPEIIDYIHTSGLFSGCNEDSCNKCGCPAYASCPNCLMHKMEDVFKQGYAKAISEFKENILMTKTNHQLGCMLECYQSIIENRIGFEKEAKQLLEIASKLK